MIEADLVVVHCGQLATIGGLSGETGPARGKALSDLGIIADGALAAKEGRLVWLGASDDLSMSIRPLPEAVTVDAAGRTVTPGLVDAHTHPVFAKKRASEFALRAAGKSYQEIAAGGGGIVSSVEHTRAATYDHLLSMARRVADRMLSMGTTTAEAKSGYGLDGANELKMLEVIAAINAEHQIAWVPTALPGHSVPSEYKTNPEGYVDLVIDEILPEIAAKRLAVFNDVFLEEGVFNREQAERIQRRAQELGFRLKFHVDQLTPQGGTELAVALGAVSADHLEFISDHGVRALAESATIAVFLPGTAYFLDAKMRPPVRRMIDAGAAVAVATDCNPGSNMSEAMPMALNQACVLYKMSPEEAFVAGTRNAAWAIARGDRIGMLREGYQCDVVVWETDDYRDLAYHYGINPAGIVIKSGAVVS